MVLVACAFFALLLAGCGSDYSPNTYSTAAVQQANKVESGVIVGVRQVAVSAAGAVGGTTGAAAGGIVGSQVPGTGVSQALTALGGSLVGGLVGSGVERAAGDTTAFEYIVRKPNGEMISVTQKDPAPLEVGRKVLVIAGAQARIVPDYTVPLEQTTPAPAPGPVTAAPLPPPAEQPKVEPPANPEPVLAPSPSVSQQI